MLRWRTKAEGLEQAQQLLNDLKNQAPEVRKLTHSLRMERVSNHLGARIRLAMESRHDDPE